MEFNKDKILIKHLLGMEIDMEGYPQPEDILYSVCKRAYDKHRKGDVTFTNNLIEKKFTDNDILSVSIKKLINNGDIVITKENSDKISYKVVKNPYL